MLQQDSQRTAVQGEIAGGVLKGGATQVQEKPHLQKQQQQLHHQPKNLAATLSGKAQAVQKAVQKSPNPAMMACFRDTGCCAYDSIPP